MKFAIRNLMLAGQGPGSELMLKRLMRWGSVHSIQFGLADIAQTKKLVHKQTTDAGFDYSVWQPLAKLIDLIAETCSDSRGPLLTQGTEFASDGFNVALLVHLKATDAEHFRTLVEAASSCLCTHQSQLIVWQNKGTCAIGLLHSRLPTRINQLPTIWILADDSTTLEACIENQLKEVG